MKRTALLFAILAGLAVPAQAGPLDWAKHHKRFLLAASAVAAGSIIQYKGTTHCQQGNVERCSEGYGSRRAFDWFSIGASVALLGAAEGCWKNDGGKVCYGLAYGNPAYQTIVGIKDWRSYAPETKRDLRDVVLVRK